MSLQTPPVQLSPVPSFSQPQAPVASSLRFGRDAIFERNDRFEKTEAPANGTEHADALERLLVEERDAGKKEPRAYAQKIADASAFLYDGRGRLLGGGKRMLAIRAASMEAALMAEAKDATSVEKAMATLKGANVAIALDINNNRTFEQLDGALKALDDAGYDPKPEDADPVYVHALYNRAMYLLNNELYEETRRNVGDHEIQMSRVAHEGLVLNLMDNDPLVEKAVAELRAELPRIDKAIALSKGQPDNIATIEYLSAKGEMLHILSHIEGDPENWDMRQFSRTSRESLDAFEAAFRLVQKTPKEKMTPRHVLLAEKLGEVKIPHLCSHIHSPEGAEQLCRQLDMGSYQLLEWMGQEGIQRPERNEDEVVFDQLSHMPPMIQVGSLDDLLRLFGGGR